MSVRCLSVRWSRVNADMCITVTLCRSHEHRGLCCPLLTNLAAHSSVQHWHSIGTYTRTHTHIPCLCKSSYFSNAFWVATETDTCFLGVEVVTKKKKNNVSLAMRSRKDNVARYSAGQACWISSVSVPCSAGRGGEASNPKSTNSHQHIH